MLFNERKDLTSFIWRAFPGLGLERQPHSPHTNRYSDLGLSFHRINLLDSISPIASEICYSNFQDVSDLLCTFKRHKNKCRNLTRYTQTNTIEVVRFIEVLCKEQKHVICYNQTNSHFKIRLQTK